MVGADFNALEARIDALLTKDPNKLKVYTEGYDSHCLAAYGYFSKYMPDIIPNDVNSINSIKTKYPELRQKSKTISFAALYGGTYHTFMDSGFSKEEAIEIENNYHKLYGVSDAWKNSKLEKATKTGYVEIAFGLKLRTPILKQTFLNKKNTPYAASSESRTVGNALGQSYGLLNNRAANEFMNKVYNSKFVYDIKIIAQIHDAIYLIIKDDIDVIYWVNKELIKSMKWQDLPEIKHSQVKLGAELSVFYPDWSNEIILPNDISKEEILKLGNSIKTL